MNPIENTYLSKTVKETNKIKITIKKQDILPDKSINLVIDDRILFSIE